MLKKIERLLPHATILICGMYVAFFLIDRVNPAMNFIDNGLTKGLLLILCAIALYNGWRLIRTSRARRPAAPAPRRYGPQGYPPRTENRMPGGYRAAPARRGYASDRPSPARPSSGRANPASRRSAPDYERRPRYDSRDGYPRRSPYGREGERR